MIDHHKIYPTTPRVQYMATGEQTTFVYPFIIFSDANLRVYINDIEQSADYTVTGVGSDTGGEVVFAVAPDAGALVTLVRIIDIERLSDFQESAALRAKVLNDELDYLTAGLQQVATHAARSIGLSPTDDTADLTLPSKALRANRLLSFDDQGNVETTQSVVASVFGRTGAVHAHPGDYTADQITETPTRVFVSPAQSEKLDGLETHATADMTGTEIVNAITVELGSTVWQTGGTGFVTWGSINGTISDQGDLVSELNGVNDNIVAVSTALEDHSLSRNGHPLATSDGHGLMSSADKEKLDGIDVSADVTDASTVSAAGAVMRSETSTASMAFVIDEDDMASDSATKVPTQQSVKAYVDAIAFPEPGDPMPILRAEAKFVPSAAHPLTESATSVVAFDTRAWLAAGAPNYTAQQGEITIPDAGSTVVLRGILAVKEGSALQFSQHTLRLQTKASGAFVNVAGAVAEGSGGPGDSPAARNIGQIPFFFGPFTTTVANEKLRIADSVLASQTPVVNAAATSLILDRVVEIDSRASAGGHGASASILNHADVPDQLAADRWWKNTADGSGVEFVAGPTATAAGSGREIQYNGGGSALAAVPGSDVSADGIAHLPQLTVGELHVQLLQAQPYTWTVPAHTASVELQLAGAPSLVIDGSALTVPESSPGRAFFTVILVRNTASNDMTVDITGVLSKSTSMPYTLPGGHELPVTIKVSRYASGAEKKRSWIGGLGA